MSFCCSGRCLTLVLCLAALGLSGYAYYEETKMLADPEYKPLCDINEQISCSKAFNSTWGKGFGLVKYVVPEDHWLNQPNPVYAAFVYPFMAFIGLFNIRFFARLQVYLAFLLNLGSVYLGYVLYVILEDLCVVCIALYTINFLLLVVSFLRLRSLKKQGGPGKQKEGRRSHQHQQQQLPTTTHDFKKNI